MPENVISIYIPKLHKVFACTYFINEHETIFWLVLSLKKHLWIQSISLEYEVGSVSLQLFPSV